MIHLEPAVLKLASLVKEIKVEELDDIAHILNQLALALRLGMGSVSARTDSQRVFVRRQFSKTCNRP